MAHQLVIVGGGNMGAALLGGMIAGGRDPSTLAVSEALADRREQLIAEFPGVTVSESIPPADGAVIAVKPGDVAAAVRAAVGGGARRLLSIAAGVTTASIEAAAATVDVDVDGGGGRAGSGVAVVRAMPNTPALVGEGASAIAGGSGAGDDDLEWAEEILGAVGLVVRVTEADLDAVTALSGSGPGYLFLVAESLIDAGVRAGLSSELAATLTAQLFVGSAKLLAERGDPAALRVAVTSPGGTTAAGLAVLGERGLHDAFVDAVAAATARSRELATPT